MTNTSVTTEFKRFNDILEKMCHFEKSASTYVHEYVYIHVCMRARAHMCVMCYVMNGKEKNCIYIYARRGNLID